MKRCFNCNGVGNRAADCKQPKKANAVADSSAHVVGGSPHMLVCMTDDYGSCCNDTRREDDGCMNHSLVREENLKPAEPTTYKPAVSPSVKASRPSVHGAVLGDFQVVA